MTGRITLPPDGEAGNPLLFACLTAALLGVLCAEAVRLSRTACAIVLTAFLSVLLLLLRPERAKNWMALCLFAALFLLTGSIRQNVTGFLSKGGLLLAAGLLAQCSGSSGNAQRERVFRVAGGERGCAALAAL